MFRPWMCWIRFIYYWFRYSTGYHVSGHDFEEQENGDLVCRDCGEVSR